MNAVKRNERKKGFKKGLKESSVVQVNQLFIKTMNWSLYITLFSPFQNVSALWPDREKKNHEHIVEFFVMLLI